MSRGSSNTGDGTEGEGSLPKEQLIWAPIQPWSNLHPPDASSILKVVSTLVHLLGRMAKDANIDSLLLLIFELNCQSNYSPPFRAPEATS